VQCDGDAHVGGDDHYAVGASVHAWSATDHRRRRYGPSVDKAGLGRDGFRGKPASGLCAGQIPPARLQPYWRGATGDGQEAFGRPSKLLLMPAAISEFIEDLPDVQRGEVNDGDHDMLQSSVKFACLREKALFYGDIPDDDTIYYHDVDVGQGSPEDLADAIEGLLTSAEQAGMPRDGVQS
jgi:hypothetical protein